MSIKSPEEKRRRMSRKRRLKHTRETDWLLLHANDTDLVGAYSEWFHVPPLCAAIELKQLGVPLPPETEQQLRERERQKQEKRRRNRAESEWMAGRPDSDENFAFIAGYTPGGFPYGTTWEEAKAQKNMPGDGDSSPLACADPTAPETRAIEKTMGALIGLSRESRRRVLWHVADLLDMEAPWEYEPAQHHHKIGRIEGEPDVLEFCDPFKSTDADYDDEDGGIPF